ncbi:MAG: hypothetical protein JOZ16_13370 [Methylobacteriaceae bacterium]|nr:hypothetical protein [Methylobacteriaceae bacterium]
MRCLIPALAVAVSMSTSAFAQHAYRWSSCDDYVRPSGRMHDPAPRLRETAGGQQYWNTYCIEKPSLRGETRICRE